MDPAKMKVVDLRSELGALGLDTKGNKPALVERLKKALETKTGKLMADTTILDTSTEDVEDTPKRPGPAARTRRRSSSVRHASTPAKQFRRESPESIPEEIKEQDQYSPRPNSLDEEDVKPESPEKSPEISPEKLPEISSQKSPEISPEKIPERDSSPVPQKTPESSPVRYQSPVREPSPVVERTPVKNLVEKSPTKSPFVEKSPEKKTSENDERSSSPIAVKEEAPEPMEVQDSADPQAESQESYDNPEKMDQEAGNEKGDGDKPERRERKSRFEDRDLTEEEEWDLLNERLQQREQERIEREKKQAEDDAKKLEEWRKDPLKYRRLKRKREKKQRWNNFYRNVEVTNEILKPPTEEDYSFGQKQGKGKKDTQTENILMVEPDLDDSKITLSWYDSDLNQYLVLPGLNEVMPLNDGAFAHAWAGVRASHGVENGRVCYEVKLGAPVTTNEAAEKDTITSALRIGWSTSDQSLHLGDGTLSWAYESTGRSVNNSEFKEYGKEFSEKDVIGAYVDLESTPCKISYTLNGVELGMAYEFDKSELGGKALFPHILTKNVCYKVNFGYERYNLLTKTKIVRNRIEVPVEQILEEKKAREEHLQKLKDEAERREKERKEKEKLEREEKQRKKREEREKQALEKKEKEAAERRERGEEVEEEKVEAQYVEAEKDTKENGDKPEEQAVEVKVEPMDTVPGEQPPLPTYDAPPPDQPPVEEPALEPKQEVMEDEPTTEIPEVTEDQVLKGHVLDKRIKFVIRHTADEELDGAEATLLPGYILIAHADLVLGPVRPATLADCEVILMVGMPGAGKTHWVKQRVAEQPEKRYNIISTGALFDKMKVDCKPLRTTYEGRWDAMVSKCAKCVLKLMEMSHGRRRNFILDQTNVYPSAQRRKLREFDGYRRVAVAILVDEETYNTRCKQRESADGKEVPDPAILDMKANFTLPEKGVWLDDVIYPELDEEESKKVVEAYHKEARAAGVLREREKRERSAGREGPAAKRQHSQDKRHGRDDRARSRDYQRGDREERWGGSTGSGGGGGGGGGRWGRGGNNGARWGRDRSNNSRFNNERHFQNNQRGNDYGSRDRDNFRGGSGGRGPGGPPGGRGPGGPPGDRFGRDRVNRPPPPLGGDRDKRQQQSMQGGGGAGSWQRGAQIASGNRGGMGNRGGGNQRGNHKDGGNPNQNQQHQQGWNQWAGGWGGWGGGWNQNQQQQQAGWNNWQNWQNWNQAAGQNQNQGQAQNQQGANKGNAQAQQWPANYTTQQWYQWQQWQQQQQNWAGYQQQQQQQQGGNQAATAQDAQAAWAQYYQSIGNAAAANAASAATSTEKKS